MLKLLARQKWTPFLAAIWLILTEDFSVVNIAAGLIISGISIEFAGKLMLSQKITGVNFAKFVLYIFYLIGQIYASSFEVMKLILKGGRAEIVEVSTGIENEFLATMLGNSIALTPGTILLDHEGNNLTVLWLRDKKSAKISREGESFAAEQIKGKLEKKLVLCGRSVKSES